MMGIPGGCGSRNGDLTQVEGRGSQSQAWGCRVAGKPAQARQDASAANANVCGETFEHIEQCQVNRGKPPTL